MAMVIGVVLVAAALVAVIILSVWLIGAAASESQGCDVVLLDGSRAKLATGRIGADSGTIVVLGGDGGGGGGCADGGGGGGCE